MIKVKGIMKGRQRSTSNTCAETKKGKIGRKERKKERKMVSPAACTKENEERRKEDSCLESPNIRRQPRID